MLCTDVDKHSIACRIIFMLLTLLVCIAGRHTTYMLVLEYCSTTNHLVEEKAL